MTFKLRRTLLGASLATGLALNSAFILAVAAQQPSAAVLSKQAFCQTQLRGENFARTELFFGLSKPDGSLVSDAEFQSFVDTVVTPLFPDGLTLLAGSGQFRDESGRVIKEGARLLILLYPFNRASSQSIDQIREAYKNAFQQQSVLRADEQSCISF